MSSYFLPYFEALWQHIEETADAEADAVSAALDRLEKRVRESHPSWAWLSEQALLEMLGMEKEPVQVVRLWVRAFVVRRSYRALSGVAHAWRVFIRRKRGLSQISVHTAHTVSEMMKETILRAVASRWGSSEVAWVIDESVLGGMRCYRDDQCWDLSIKSRIGKLALAFGIRGMV